MILLVAAIASISFSQSSVHAQDAGGTAKWGLKGKITAVWANDGGDKVRREERRTVTKPQTVSNSVWDGTKIKVFGARNEVVSFNAILEASDEGAKEVSATLESLTGPNGAKISSYSAKGDEVFSWARENSDQSWSYRNIELFYVRYLQIKGLSQFSYDTYDERHVPSTMQLPWSFDDRGLAKGKGEWTQRPGADQHYPDIAVPIELVPSFDIAKNENQSVWADIYIPRSAPAGEYYGEFKILQGGQVVRVVPVQLRVRNFEMPNVPTSKTMLYLGYEDINERYLDQRNPKAGSKSGKDVLSRMIRDRHFMVAHRHKISLIDANPGAGPWAADSPRPDWIPRLNGNLFSELYGYDGPGLREGNGIYSIGTYRTWDWKREHSEEAMHERTDAWESWFQKFVKDLQVKGQPPVDIERFLYLVDESEDYQETESWAKWMKNNKGPGGKLKSFATIALPHAVHDVPSLNIAASLFTVGDTATWQKAAEETSTKKDKQFWLYNGKRPATGSFATEDDGVALRQLSWAQHKKNIGRWFFWESTYYDDFQSGTGRNNVMQKAQTIGSYTRHDKALGDIGYNYSNGDGVLFYPGTDAVFPEDSYGVKGPLASLRLKHWRRGVQDVDYIALAAKVDPARVNAIVQRMVPKTLWDLGVADVNDPTWTISDIGWSINPDDWERARAELADIIEKR